MSYLISFDPGVYSGVALGTLSEKDPYRLLETWQVPNGAEGFKESLILRKPVADIAVSEKFVIRNMAGFSHTADSVEPLRVEGVLVAVYPEIHWQEPSAQNLVSGKTPSETKRLSDDFLRYHGLYQEPSTIEGRQKNDANSAIKHALAYLKGIGHKPTIDKYWRNYNG